MIFYNSYRKFMLELDLEQMIKTNEAFPSLLH